MPADPNPLLARIAATRELMLHAVVVGCRGYANGAFGAVAGVRAHFTKGNEARYSFAPLSPRYLKWKTGAAPKLKKGMKAANRAVPKGAGLPTLVLTGALRDAVSSGRAVVSIVSMTQVRILWRGLPEYARYHEDGTPRMPARSPIQPSAADRAAIIATARRWLSAQIGVGNASAAVGGPRARVR